MPLTHAYIVLFLSQTHKMFILFYFFVYFFSNLLNDSFEKKRQSSLKEHGLFRDQKQKLSYFDINNLHNSFILCKVASLTPTLHWFKWKIPI